jgi:hypothetical protein
MRADHTSADRTGFAFIHTAEAAHATPAYRSNLPATTQRENAPRGTFSAPAAATRASPGIGTRKRQDDRSSPRHQAQRARVTAPGRARRDPIGRTPREPVGSARSQ